MKRIVPFLLCLFVVAGCGLQTGGVNVTHEYSVKSSSEALLVPLVMHVMPGTLQMTPPKGRLYESSTNPTPNLTLVTVLNSGTIGLYSTSAKQAIVSVTPTEFALINTYLATSGHTVDVNLTYDDSGTATNKTVTAVTFTLI